VHDEDCSYERNAEVCGGCILAAAVLEPSDPNATTKGMKSVGHRDGIVCSGSHTTLCCQMKSPSANARYPRHSRREFDDGAGEQGATREASRLVLRGAGGSKPDHVADRRPIAMGSLALQCREIMEAFFSPL